MGKTAASLLGLLLLLTGCGADKPCVQPFHRGDVVQLKGIPSERYVVTGKSQGYCLVWLLDTHLGASLIEPDLLELAQ